VRTQQRPVAQKIAVWLAGHAANVLPRSRSDWASAMRNEVHHISGNQPALSWALGCVFASYQERIRTMMGWDPRISRWVLVLEMLCCFTPLTFLCLAVLGNLDRMPGKDGVIALTVAAAGPIGLMVAFRIVVLNRPSLTKLAMTALAIMAAWTVLIYSLHLVTESGVTRHWWEAWREFLLIALLPAFGIVHLCIWLQLRRTRRRRHRSASYPIPDSSTFN
jgi:hypothetical protein